jgi:imidazole glycerol phosphate synthase glutamine amidotransferase subunit
VNAPARRLTIGVVDYGAGNLASVARAVTGLGHRCRVSRDTDTLAATDALVLPGVGAFPAAMAALHRHRLVEFLQRQARAGQPLVGICLGMQLLAETSSEHRVTSGLGLIPGHVHPLEEAGWHIGWNRLEVRQGDPLLGPSDGEALYFNHAYVFSTPAEYVVGVARLQKPFTAAVRRGRVIGLQFHPEKSQLGGQDLLRRVFDGLSGDATC